MTDTEKALYVTGAEGLRYYEPSFSRLYFGTEFCERLIPPQEELLGILEFTNSHKLDFSFLTPYVTDFGLKELDLLFRLLEREKPRSEVVFNDWGTLMVLAEGNYALEPVMGRLLNKMKRDPRLAGLASILPQATLDYYRDCGLGVSAYQGFLRSFGVRRVELDNVPQGMAHDFTGTELSVSLYSPYAYITTTRLCLAASCDVHGKEDEVAILACQKECKKYSFELNHPALLIPLIRKGNTVFFRNDSIPAEAKGLFNRQVIEPEIPL